MTLVAPFWPQRPWFPDLLGLIVDSLVALPQCHDLLRQPRFPSTSSRDPQAVLSCLATVQRFARAKGFSARVATQDGFTRWPSSRTNYQVKWFVYWRWRHVEGHSISRLTLPKIADFLFWLRCPRKLSVSFLLGYQSMLSSVFRFKLPEISTSSVLRDRLRSFKVEAPVHPVRPPSWDLDAVLHYLNSSTFEPLSSTSLRSLTKKVLFLVSLATAKRVGELQALSRHVSFTSSDACLSTFPSFFLPILTLLQIPFLALSW